MKQPYTFQDLRGDLNGLSEAIKTAHNPDDPKIITVLEIAGLILVTFPFYLLTGRYLYVLFYAQGWVSFMRRNNGYRVYYDYFYIDILFWVFLLLGTYFGYLHPVLAAILFLYSLRNVPRKTFYEENE